MVFAPLHNEEEERAGMGAIVDKLPARLTLSLQAMSLLYERRRPYLDEKRILSLFLSCLKFAK